jgi:catechol 2,3-dioxygenase-like lactoylglutathione lyase family enzyme
MPSNGIPALSGILEAALYVDELPRSKAFYQDLFGFELEAEDLLICVLRVTPGQVFILFPKALAGQPGRSVSPSGTIIGVIPPHGGSGLMHVAFSIPADTLESWRTRLTERNIKIEAEVHWNRGGKSLYFRDLDGHLVELVTPGLWSNYV